MKLTDTGAALHKPFALAIMAFACGGCSSDEKAGSGSLVVLLESEEVIVDGLAPGDDTDSIRDGWTVTFNKYIIVVGDVHLYRGSEAVDEAAAPDHFAVDLVQVPSSGLELWSFEELKAGRWEFAYASSSSGQELLRDASVSQADFREIRDNDWTYLIEGTLESDEGQSCPPANLAEPGGKLPNGKTSGDNDCYDAKSIEFVIGAEVETEYGPCEIDGIPGVSVPSGGTQAVAITIHGDHIFFNGFPEGSEGGIRREAQWLADCDLDLDGTVTREELESITPAQLPTMEDYQFGGAPLEPSDMYEYLRAQLKTQGHYQGEGECPIDGEAHDHDE